MGSNVVNCEQPWSVVLTFNQIPSTMVNPIQVTLNTHSKAVEHGQAHTKQRLNLFTLAQQAQEYCSIITFVKLLNFHQLLMWHKQYFSANGYCV
jgi:uncharacterized membrane protein YccC